ncbi:eCIS core domain-containing protein [Sorangium sp. So ce854]|uniref:eCIS core domain-containing protein n=1 Tax=Sorangium sp. So ce854 TaxID=3133322 RepID=UPI003F63CE7F
MATKAAGTAHRDAGRAPAAETKRAPASGASTSRAEPASPEAQPLPLAFRTSSPPAAAAPGGRPSPPGAPAGLGDGASGAPLRIVVEDGAPLGAGQVHVGAFVQTVADAITRASNEELARAGRTADDCPYITHWLAYYRRQSAAHVERAIQRYVRPTRRDPAGLREEIAARVRVSVRRWVDSGGRVLDVVPGVAPLGDDDGIDDREGGAAAIQRKALPGAGAIGASPAAVLARLGAGAPLDGGVRARMEQSFGRSFSHVRVHADAAAARAASDISARAFTVGQDIAFGAGAYRPGTLAGDALLAHELAHTVQQRGAGGAVQRAPLEATQVSSLEQDADRAAVAAILPSYAHLSSNGELSAHARAHGAHHLAAEEAAASARPALSSGLRLQRCSRSTPPDTTLYAPAVPRTGEQFRANDIPGQVSTPTAVGDAVELTFDGDGDQMKELRARVRWVGRSGRIVELAITQISSGVTRTATFDLQNLNLHGERPMIAEITDGSRPTRIGFSTNGGRADLLLHPPTRSQSGVSYRMEMAPTYLNGSQMTSSPQVQDLDFPAETTPTRRVFTVERDPTTGRPLAPTRVGNLHWLDVGIGAYADRFRLTFRRESASATTADATIAVVSGGTPYGGQSVTLNAGDPFGVTVVDADGVSLGIDLNGDGDADLRIHDRLYAPDGADPAVRRHHSILFTGRAVGGSGRAFEYDVADGRITAGTITPALWQMQAASDASAASGLQQQQDIGTLRATFDAQGRARTRGEIETLEATAAMLRRQALDTGLIQQGTFDAWTRLAQDFVVIEAAARGSGQVQEDVRTRAATDAGAFVDALTAEAGTEFTTRDVLTDEGGQERTNPYTGVEQRRWVRRERDAVTGEEREVVLLSIDTSNPGWALRRSIESRSWAAALLAYRRLVTGFDRWITERARRQFGAPNASRADSLVGLQLQRNAALASALRDIERHNPVRVSAVFHPQEAFMESGRITEVPLSLYYWRDGDDWRLQDLTNPAPSEMIHVNRRAAPGETEPPDALFQRLEEGPHFARGIIRYVTPSGRAGQVQTTGPGTWRTILTWLGIGLAAVGAGLVTFGKGTVAVLGMYALGTSAAIGAGMATQDLIQRGLQGNLTPEIVILDLAQIVAAISGIGAMRAGFLVRGATTAAAQSAPLTGTAASAAAAASSRVVPLAVTNLAADVVNVVILTPQLAESYDAIDQNVSDPGERTRAHFMLLLHGAATLGLTALSVRGNAAEITAGRSIRLVELDGVRYAIPEGVSAVGSRMGQTRTALEGATTEAELLTAEQAHLRAIRGGVGSGGGEPLALVEGLAQRTRWRSREAQRVLEPLEQQAAAAAASNPELRRQLAQLRADVEAIIGRSFPSAAERQAALRARLQEFATAHPELAGVVDVAAAQTRAGTVGGLAAEGTLVADASGNVTVPGRGPTTTQELVEQVLRANNANRAHGVDIEYVLESVPGETPGTTRLQITSRRRTAAPIDPTAPTSAHAARPYVLANQFARARRAHAGSTIVVLPSGNLSINGQLTISPTRLAEITDADLAELLRLTRLVQDGGGNMAALRALPRAERSALSALRSRYNVRFEFQRRAADALLRELGIDQHPLFQNMSEESRSRLHQGLVGDAGPTTRDRPPPPAPRPPPAPSAPGDPAAQPGGPQQQPGARQPRAQRQPRAPAPQPPPLPPDLEAAPRDLQFQAANWALARNPGSVSEFVDLYQFYIAAFKERLRTRITARDQRIQTLLDDWNRANPNASDAAREAARGRITNQVHTEQGMGSDDVMAGDLFRELGQPGSPRAAGAGADTIADLWTAGTTWWNGRIGVRSVLHPGETMASLTPEEIVRRIRTELAQSISFNSVSSATYHTRKHFPEIANAAGEVQQANGQPLWNDSYLASARRTVANPSQSDRQIAQAGATWVYGGSRSYIFQRQLSNGRTMGAIVVVNERGQVFLATYFSGAGGN